MPEEPNMRAEYFRKDEPPVGGSHDHPGGPYKREQPEDERGQENPLGSWAKELKEKIDKGEVFACVQARTNFRLVRDGDSTRVEPRLYEGQNGEFALRGVSEKESNDLYNAAHSYSNRNGVSHDEFAREQDHLYVLDMPVEQLNEGDKRESLRKFKGKRVVEIRYTQPVADDDGRKAFRWTYFVMDPGLADKTVNMLQHADPNSVRDSLASIFVEPGFEEYFDASLINTMSRTQEKPIRLTPEKRDLKDVILTKDGKTAPIERNSAEAQPAAPPAPEPPLPTEPEVKKDLSTFEKAWREWKDSGGKNTQAKEALKRISRDFADEDLDRYNKLFDAAENAARRFVQLQKTDKALKLDDYVSSFERVARQKISSLGDEKLRGLAGIMLKGEISRFGYHPVETLDFEALSFDALEVYDVYPHDFQTVGDRYRPEDGEDSVPPESPVPPIPTGPGSPKPPDQPPVPPGPPGEPPDQEANPEGDQSNNPLYLKMVELGQMVGVDITSLEDIPDEKIREEIRRFGTFGARGMSELRISRLTKRTSQMLDEQDAGMASGDFPYDDNTLEIFLAAVSELDQEFKDRQVRGQGFGLSPEQAAQMQEQTDYLRVIARGQEEQTRLNREQLEALRSGYQSFVVTEFEQRNQMGGTGIQAIPEKETWYNYLTPEMQKVVNLRINFLRGVNLKSQDVAALAATKDIQINKDTLDVAWMHMPVYRVAMATMTKDLFRERQRVLTLTDDPDMIDTLKSGLFNSQYREDLVRRVALYLDDHPEAIEQGTIYQPPRVDNLTHAYAAVSMAWNQMDMFFAPESSDPERQILDESFENDSPRALLMPHRKLMSKTTDQVARGDMTAGWGGKLGDWIEQRIRRDPDFRARVQARADGYRFLPERTLYSYFDHLTFDRGAYSGRSFADVLVNADKSDIGYGLVDYTQPDRIRYADLRTKSNEIWYDYRDKLEAVSDINTVVLAKSDDIPKVAGKIEALGDSFTKLRKDDDGPVNVRENYMDEDFAMSCVLVMGGGPTKGVSRILVDLPNANWDYDAYLNGILANADKLLDPIEEINPGVRDRIRGRLLVVNPVSQTSAFKSMFGDVLGVRRKVKSEISRERRRRE